MQLSVFRPRKTQTNSSTRPAMPSVAVSQRRPFAIRNGLAVCTQSPYRADTVCDSRWWWSVRPRSAPATPHQEDESLGSLRFDRPSVYPLLLDF